MTPLPSRESASATSRCERRDKRASPEAFEILRTEPSRQSRKGRRRRSMSFARRLNTAPHTHTSSELTRWRCSQRDATLDSRRCFEKVDDVRQTSVCRFIVKLAFETGDKLMSDKLQFVVSLLNSNWTNDKLKFVGHRRY